MHSIKKAFNLVT